MHTRQRIRLAVPTHPNAIQPLIKPISPFTKPFHLIPFRRQIKEWIILSKFGHFQYLSRYESRPTSCTCRTSGALRYDCSTLLLYTCRTSGAIDIAQAIRTNRFLSSVSGVETGIYTYISKTQRSIPDTESGAIGKRSVVLCSSCCNPHRAHSCGYTRSIAQGRSPIANADR